MHADEITGPTLIEQRNLILLPYEDQWAQVIPSDGKLIAVQGRVLYAVPNTPGFNAVLYNMGVHLPSPILFSDYDWSGVQIFAAQAEMAALISTRKRCYNLSWLGTGKTIGSLLAVDWLIVNGYIEKALVIAPLSVLWNVWRDEIMKRMKRLRPIVLHGPREKRLKLLATKHWSVAIINHDAVKLYLDELMTQKFGLVVVDEAAQFRDVRTAKHKALAKLLKPVEFAAALTGSPTPNFPSDAYGLAKLFTPERVPMSFRNFRMRVEYEVQPHRWLPRPGYAEKINKLLQPAVRFRRSDVIELAGSSTRAYPVYLSARQQKAYDALKKHAMARFPEGDVTAANAAIVRNKLLQISAGCVYTKNREVVNLDPAHRIDTAHELIQAAEGKAIVIAPYLHVGDMLKAKFPGAELVNGKTKPKDRIEIFNSFQDPHDPLRLIIAHQEVLAHGLNLTQANLIVWFAPIDSREMYEQVNGRITRMGQEREQLIAHLVGSPAEAAAYRNLEHKGQIQDVVLALFEDAPSFDPATIGGGATDNNVSQADDDDDRFSVIT